MIIKIEINDEVPIDEVSYVLRRLEREIAVSGLSDKFIRRVFNSSGDPVGTAAFEVPSPVPVGVPESPVEA